MNPSPTLADRLPDIPRWVEARGSLLSGSGEVFGLRETPALSFIVREPPLLTVVGEPEARALAAALDSADPVDTLIAPLELTSHLRALLPDWRQSSAILHLLTDTSTLPTVPAGSVAFLEAEAIEMLEGVEEELWDELRDAATHSAIAATMAEGRPVSFCYAGSVTETLWDVSIDTLPAFRRRGYAGLCARAMIDFMKVRGQAPVWGSDVANPASWRLAEKLGFTAVDEIALFEERGEEG